MALRPRGDRAAEPSRPTRRQNRYLLPSCRVAAFLVPNVGEILEIREQAMTEAKNESNMALGLSLGRIILRRMLSGITVSPVPPIYKDGFDASSAAAIAEQRVRAKAAERYRTLGKLPDDAEVPDEVIDLALRQMLEVETQAVETEHEDVDAMCQLANLEPVTDFMWNERKGSSYLHQMPLAELGTPEAADWIALNEVAIGLLPTLTEEQMIGPKAPSKTKIRPLRASSGG